MIKKLKGAEVYLSCDLQSGFWVGGIWPLLQWKLNNKSLFVAHLPWRQWSGPRHIEPLGVPQVHAQN